MYRGSENDYHQKPESLQEERRMKNLKKYMGLLLALILCLSMAACGGNAPETLENIVLDDSIDYSIEDTYDEYLGEWYQDIGRLWVTENNGTYFYELYDTDNEVISSGQLQYVKEYRCMYAYSEQEGNAHKCRIGKGDTLYIDSFGTFGRDSSVYMEVIGQDWRTWGIVRESGTITRDGEDTVVLVCVHASDANFYYDTEDQTLFGYVEYPITLESDAWEAFQGIDFSDLNGDGNSDVTMNFNDGGNELLMVWFWDTESEQFVYQPEEEVSVPVLTSSELPFTNMETQQSETYEDGTYYYADVAEDGLVKVVNTVTQRHWVHDVQTLEEYIGACALTLSDADTYDSLTVEKNAEYSEKLSYPVYVVTYASGGNEDTREWTVFAMDTDSYTYLYGLGVTSDAPDDLKSVYQDVFTGLYLSDEE